MTTHSPRPYQADVESRTELAWASGARNVLAVMPTGAGKTFLISRHVSRRRAACVCAHRSELVTQISTALAREGVRHRVIGPPALSRACSAAHLDEVGRDFVDPGARIAAAGVDTLRNLSPSDPWLAQVELWVQDEAHHVTAENKWGDVCGMFPNAIGLGVTATPMRADGKGLGRHADGLFDTMIVGPSMRDLIDEGYLTDYRVISAPSDIDLSSVPVAGSGEYSPKPLAAARKRSTLTGDVVKEYLRWAPGKLGVTFDVDIESATATAAAFRAAGVPAEVVTGKTPEALRRAILRRFKSREILQLVNVDLFGEGFDLPAIEVVSFARPTMSYGLYVQQFGRSLRKLDGKLRAIIIDHVGNVIKHGLPDAPREWSLNRRERKSRSAPSDVIPTRTCLFVGPDGVPCANVYERVLTCCPECGHMPVPADRSGPDRVDGDLTELDPAVLAKLRGEIARVDGQALIPQGVPHVAQLAARKNHIERQQHQAQLRAAIALWAGWQHEQGRGTTESYRRFYFRYGVDVATACALGSREADELREKIQADLERAKVVDATVISE